jgi:predicted Rossmann fold flavoprotein
LFRYLKRMKPYDVVILGGGAAGLMCAREAAARGRKVLVLEQNTKPAPKILVSGGGRCNFTNLHATPANYVTTNPSFVPAALSRFTPKDFIALVQARSIPFHEKKDGQLFCDKSARDIIDLLVTRAKEKGVEILLGQKVGEITHSEGSFTVHSNGEIFTAPRLVVATGGLSWPQLGASDLGFKIARQFGLKVIEPAPALVGLAFPEREMARFKDLAGIHLRVGVSCGGWSLVEDLMITHKGLSGPVMLNTSLYWKPGQEIIVNWVPELTVESTYQQLRKDKAAGGRGKFRVWFSGRIPRRLAERIAWNAEARGSWAALADERLMALARDIHAYRFVPAGTFGYRMAEVMRGGVDTREISRETMEARKVPGLFFIGEVLDVTGQLGGFNFQWAWATGYVAGQAV